MKRRAAPALEGSGRSVVLGRPLPAHAPLWPAGSFIWRPVHSAVQLCAVQTDEAAVATSTQSRSMRCGWALRAVPRGRDRARRTDAGTPSADADASHPGFGKLAVECRLRLPCQDTATALPVGTRALAPARGGGPASDAQCILSSRDAPGLGALVQSVKRELTWGRPDLRHTGQTVRPWASPESITSSAWRLVGETRVGLMRRSMAKRRARSTPRHQLPVPSRSERRSCPRAEQR